MIEEIKARKFRALRISEEDFDELPVEERLSRLLELKEVEEIALAGRYDDQRDAEQRRLEVSDLLSNALSRQFELGGKTVRLENVWTAYRDVVHEQRVEIGRLAAYSHWYKVAERRLEVSRMRHYGIKIALQREKLPALRADVAEARAEFGTLPRLRRMLKTSYREMAALRDVASRYKDRIGTLAFDVGYYGRRITTLYELIGEIDTEIEELRAKPKVVRHRYREVSFEIHKAMEYGSAKSGSDIDIEMTLGGVFKTLLPTRFEGNEDGWIEDIEVMFRNAACGLMDDCFAEEYFALDAEVDIRCNVVDRRVVKRTMINASKFYKDLEPPITLKILRPILRKEIERYTRLTITLFQFMRSHVLGKEKSRNVGAEHVISRCIKRKSNALLSELVDYSMAEEIDALMRFLSED